MMAKPRIGVLFNHDWDALGFDRLADHYRFDEAGFDLFSFPSNARLIGFDLQRFATRQAARARLRGWAGVVSHHEQFGALAAALVAEKLGLPGTPVAAVLACQHKLHARAVLQQVCPEANLRHAALDACYGGPVPAGVVYPAYVKPVKAAFSVLARRVQNQAELHQHTRFGRRELWVIRRLVEPFERVARLRLPQAGSAHRMLLEEPVAAAQFNLDGWVYKGRAHALGVVDAVMYPGTQAFMRWEHPSRLAASVQARALDVAQRFLAAVGFDHGMFNIEFFYQPATDRMDAGQPVGDRMDAGQPVGDRLSVIEVNPRLASQFSDLYRHVRGLDPHAMSLALALGQDPLDVPRSAPVAGAAASLVYRSFVSGASPPMPSTASQALLARRFPDALLFTYPKAGHSLARDFKWLGSHRYGILHLHGHDAAHLKRRAETASALIGWTAPYADSLTTTPATTPATTPDLPSADPPLHSGHHLIAEPLS